MVSTAGSAGISPTDDYEVNNGSAEAIGRGAEICELAAGWSTRRSKVQRLQGGRTNVRLAPEFRQVPCPPPRTALVNITGNVQTALASTPAVPQP
jgi:hypothetical protein